jgi:flap endonuclease-1
MGIKGLKKIIKRHAPDAISLNFSLYNKKIAIDSSILLYKFRYTYTQDNFHIQGFLYKIIELLEKGITPVFVFDGPPPQAKRDTLDKRIETRVKMQERVKELCNLRNSIAETNQIDPEEYIDSEDETENPFVKEIKKINNQIRNISKNILFVKKVHSDEVMEFLNCLGIPFLKAVSESEETCAVLQKRRLVDYVLTEDTDALTFGGSQVILGNELYNLDQILTGLEINYDSFVDLCILCGCDYTCTIPKVGPVNALRLIKRYRSIDNFENITIPEEFDYTLARTLFLQNEGYDVNVNFEFKPMDLSKVEELFERYSLNIFFLEKLKILLKDNNRNE